MVEYLRGSTRKALMPLLCLILGATGLAQLVRPAFDRSAPTSEALWEGLSGLVRPGTLPAALASLILLGVVALLAWLGLAGYFVWGLLATATLGFLVTISPQEDTRIG